MPQTVRQYLGSLSGRTRINFNWGAIDRDSVVLVSASEYSPNTGDPKRSPRFVGAANLKVSNVAPHGPPNDPNHGVTFVVTSDWGAPLHVVTDITVLDDKPIDIEFQSPPDRLDIDTGPIVFKSGVPVGGNAHLTLFNDGNYEFSGHFHDSGATEYNVGIVIAVKDGANNAIAFEHQGHVSGTFESGPRDNDWNDTGQRPEIARDWWDIASANASHWEAEANIDLGNLLNTVVGALGTGLGIVALIVA
jgi:hypothetical protein